MLTIAKINAAVAASGVAIVRKGKGFAFEGPVSLMPLEVARLNDRELSWYEAQAKRMTHEPIQVEAAPADLPDVLYPNQMEAVETIAERASTEEIHMPRGAGKTTMTQRKVINAAEMIDTKRRKLPAERRNWYVWVEMLDNGVNYVRAAATLKPAFDAVNLHGVRIFVGNADLARYGKAVRKHAGA